MKQFRRNAAAFLGMLLLCGCSGAESVSEPDSIADAEPETKSLVTLGDSISFGYGLDDPGAERYSAILRERLSDRDKITWEDFNYAVSGDDSGDLIHKLNNGRALHAPSADAIILYIGANNLLGAYTDYFMDKAEENGLNLENIESVTEEEIEEIQRKMESEMQDPQAVMQEVQTRIDENLVSLETDLETIYQWIRERNPEADLYILNIYNPYTEGTELAMLPEDTDIADYANRQILRANSIIADLTEKHDDLIPVDIAAAYAAADPVPVIGMTNAEASGEENMEYYDPHPDKDGQLLIADTVWDVMKDRK